MQQSRSEHSAPARNAVLVLGMHRSGTSALAGVLSELGCDVPATEMHATADNARGYFESRKIYQFHTCLLESADTTWDGWEPVHPDWLNSPRAPEYRDKALTVLNEEFGNSPLFVLKDPRICRLMPFWLDVLKSAGCQPLVVHTHRNPIQVAKSLQARDGMLPELSHLIWLRHVVDAEYGSRGLPRYFTSYDRLLDNWSGVITAMQDRLGLTLPRFTDRTSRRIDEFLSPDLKHHNDPASHVLDSRLLPEWVRETYSILERWATKGENPADHAALDRIRTQFDESGQAFSALSDTSRKLATDLRKQQDANQAETARAIDLETRV